MKGNIICYVYFSKIDSGAHILPHYGISNIRLRYQLCLESENCWIRVGDEVRFYKEGESFALDDTYLHEVKNEGKTSRVILLMDFYHIDLNQQDIDDAMKFLGRDEK